MDAHNPASPRPCNCGGENRISIDPSTDWQSVIGPGAQAGISVAAPPLQTGAVLAACDACPFCDDVCQVDSCPDCRSKRTKLEEIDGEGSDKQRIRYYTRCQVRRHNSDKSCWLEAHGKVYDVTSMVRSHPGGARAILRHAGTESTQDFEFHSAKAQKLWKKMQIGKIQHCPRDGPAKGSCVVS